uniref:Protein kinase domain-containing protein n=1 Tax=Macrostomum lignano TaxID=282301 RepID=A0A1I8F3J1_9PLAT
MATSFRGGRGRAPSIAPGSSSLRMMIDTEDPLFQGMKKLKIQGRNLTAVPPELFKPVRAGGAGHESGAGGLFCTISWPMCPLPSLKSIHLANNKFVHFPAAVLRCTQMEFLDISDNMLQKVPKAIRRLTNLETLMVFSNQLRGLPDEICDLVQLRCVWLGFNKVANLPKNFGRLKLLDWSWHYTSTILNENPLICKQGADEIERYFAMLGQRRHRMLYRQEDDTAEDLQAMGPDAEAQKTAGLFVRTKTASTRCQPSRRSPASPRSPSFWQRWSRSATVKSFDGLEVSGSPATCCLLVALALAGNGLAGRDWHWDSGPQLPLGLLTLEFLLSSALWSVWRRLLLWAPPTAAGDRPSVSCLTPVRVQRRFRLLAVLLLTAPAQTAAVSVVDDVNCGGDSVAEADSDADDSAENRRGGGQADRPAAAASTGLASRCRCRDPDQEAAPPAAVGEPGTSRSDPLNLLTDLAGEPRAPRPTPAAFPSVAGLTAS